MGHIYNFIVLVHSVTANSGYRQAHRIQCILGQDMHNTQAYNSANGYCTSSEILPCVTVGQGDNF